MVVAVLAVVVVVAVKVVVEVEVVVGILQDDAGERAGREHVCARA